MNVDLTLILLLIAMGIFGILTIKSRNLKSFQFHVSVIIIIWIVGEVIGILNDMNIIEFVSLTVNLYIQLQWF